MMYAEYLTCDFLDKYVKVEITRRFCSFIRISDRGYRIIERFTSSIETGNVEVITRESVTRTVLSFLSASVNDGKRSDKKVEGDDLSPGIVPRLHELILRLELYLPYAPLPGGGGILPAVSGSGASGGCRPVLLGGVDLSMSAAVQPPVATLPTNLTSSGPIAAHNSLHHTSGGGLALPLGAAAGPPVMMPRPPPGAMPPLGPTLPPTHQDEDLADAAPNQDVLLALLARNKNLEDVKFKAFARLLLISSHRCPPFSSFFSATRISPCPLSYLSSRSRFLLHIIAYTNTRVRLLVYEYKRAFSVRMVVHKKLSVYTWEHKPEASGLFSLEACSPIAYHIG
ncbi:hypothetical protein ALC53_03815 [Atta colombica]|uniref:Uncharacterized protein n=1 Tax=Atta colombica TaxID=520822 RepID=A0A195BMW3_9HYME|nr:hypothetical protein ALC53_03815 [Atta colombica]